MTEELYINNECVDIEPDTRLTLNFKSNLLGDISKITASNSQTIRLPKTAKNRRIMDNPSAVAYHSEHRYKRYRASYIRNGIEIVKVAYAVLLSSSECYEIAIYWGVMAQFQAWIDKGGKLNDLAGEESVTWNQSSSATTLALMKSRGYGYASYDCGVSNTSLVNIHPSATAWWILSKISTQAGFTIEMPDKYKEVLRSIAVPCLSVNASKASNISEATVTIYPFLTYSNGFWGYTIDGNNGTDKHKIFDKEDNTRIRRVDDATEVSLSIVNRYGGLLAMSVYSNDANSFKPRVYVRATQYNDKDETTTQIAVSIGSTAVTTSSGLYKYVKTYHFADIAVELHWGQYEYLRLYPHDGTGRIAGSRLGDAKLTIVEDFDNIIYPGLYPIPHNTPAITQVDFIKAICGMFGLFVVADPNSTNNLNFVSLDELQRNKMHAVDWSSKLIKSNDDEPKAVEFKINDYCQNNLFKYKEDDTVSARGDGNLKINSEVLSKEKTVLTIPFVPSDGSKILHYKLNSDGSKAESTKAKDRIMSLVDDGAGLSSLSFRNLDFPTLLSKYYSTLSHLLNNAIVITERFALNEADLKTLDYTTPLYLRQYGKYYGIISIQTSDHSCEVKAVQLLETPPIEREAITISYISDGSAVLAVADKVVSSDILVQYELYLGGPTSAYPGEVTLPAGTREVLIAHVTRQYYGTKILSLSPDSDVWYKYVIADQTEENA